MTTWDTRLGPWFASRNWRVRLEVSGEVTLGGVKTVYRDGEFEIELPGVFITPLGHRGRRGFLLVQTDDNGHDVPGTESAWGEATLRRANELFHTVSGLRDPVEE